MDGGIDGWTACLRRGMCRGVSGAACVGSYSSRARHMPRPRQGNTTPPSRQGRALQTPDANEDVRDAASNGLFAQSSRRGSEGGSLYKSGAQARDRGFLGRRFPKSVCGAHVLLSYIANVRFLPRSQKVNRRTSESLHPTTNRCTRSGGFSNQRTWEKSKWALRRCSRDKSVRS